MTLRILSYNILYGGEDRLPLITNIIQAQQADVVALLEANSRANAETLAGQLGMNLTFGESNSDFHVAWLSKLPVIRAKNYRLPVLAKTLLEIDISWEGIPLALFATHLTAGRNEEHERYRVAEMQAILEVLQSLEDRPHALVGDLNTLDPEDVPDLPTEVTVGTKQLQPASIPWQVHSLLLKAGYVDCYRTVHPTRQGYTYKWPTPILRIDYIFATPSLAQQLSACEVVVGEEAAIASDHLPIWAEFIP
jgi:exodeoxyribonuclease-3